MYDNNQDYQQQNYQYQDQENQQDLINKEYEDTNLLGKSRQGFIRKVYLILLSMLAMTVGMTAISFGSQSFRNFQADNLWLYIVLCVAAVIIQIAVFCYQHLATKVPTNYILCYSFAFCFSWMVSTICGFYKETNQQQVVFIAAGMTFGITLALTLYAMTTKTDFTMLGGFLWVFAMTFILFGMFFWIFNSQVMNIVYCSIGVFLYGMYLIFDTQLIVGGKRFELDYDHYILGAMMLFIDIIGMFLYLLQLLGSR